MSNKEHSTCKGLKVVLENYKEFQEAGRESWDHTAKGYMQDPKGRGDITMHFQTAL